LTKLLKDVMVDKILRKEETMRKRRVPEKFGVTVYLTEEEIDAIEKIADEMGRSRARQIRLMILKALKLKEENE